MAQLQLQPAAFSGPVASPLAHWWLVYSPPRALVLVCLAEGARHFGAASLHLAHEHVDQLQPEPAAFSALLGAAAEPLGLPLGEPECL